ncbi:MAG: hypothetical protein E6772_15550 [Dysgonomonas sp.]|nr:hypothetical protein [Dysgonomonas sp.]
MNKDFIHVFFIAFFGLLLSLIIHIFAITGVDIEYEYPATSYLGMIIFIIWLPAILLLINKKKSRVNNQEDTETSSSDQAKTFFNDILGDSPKPLKIIAITCWIYGFINFTLFLSNHPDSVGIIDNEYVLHEKGYVRKKLTKKEYHYQRAVETRGFSGHWLIFYGVATAILYPFKARKEEKK